MTATPLHTPSPLELIIHRDSDGGTDTYLFAYGQPCTEVAEYHIDPGRGTAEDADEQRTTREQNLADASPAARALLLKLYGHSDSHPPHTFEPAAVSVAKTEDELLDGVVAGRICGERPCKIARRLNISQGKVHRLTWKAVSLSRLPYPGGPELDVARIMRLLCDKLPGLCDQGWPPIEVRSLGPNVITIGQRHGPQIHLTVAPAPDSAEPTADGAQ
ncbi:hypothetical protein [Nocardia altamirensis]|uniref:hypothetical protein n=1 Tax=Nocardia altamirensis TaxID=472158 RepID=UPI000840793C|nr:hypothetical protein [Nocardia altamirensis]